MNEWTQEEVAKISELKDQRYGWPEIANHFPGRNGESCRKIYWKLYHAGKLPGSNAAASRTAADAVAEMKQAAERNSGLTVTSQWEADDTDLEGIWKQTEIDSIKRIEKAHQQAKFEASFPPGRVSAVAMASDQHIAPGTPVDFTRMRVDAELIRDTRDLYCVLAGDGLDNHIKHRAATLAARSQPGDQWQLYSYYLGILREKLICLTTGNHEAWTNQFAGLDVVHMLAKQHRVCYAPFEARINAKVGNQTYKLAARHQYRFNSSFNQNHSPLQWLRLGEEEFDVGAIGHHHEACLHQTVYRGQLRWVCRPGSYQISSAYSAQYGFNHSIPTVPTFLLFPDRRHIIGLADVRDAPTLLRAFNG